MKTTELIWNNVTAKKNLPTSLKAWRAESVQISTDVAYAVCLYG